MTVEIRLTFATYEEASIALSHLYQGQRAMLPAAAEAPVADFDEVVKGDTDFVRENLQQETEEEAPKPKKEKKKKEAKAEAPAKELTIDDARNALQTLSEKIGLPAATEFVKAQGYARVSAIPAAEIAAFVEAALEKAA